MAKLDQLREELDSLITQFADESERHKRLYRGLRYTTLILTGTATALASIALTSGSAAKSLNVAVVIATVLSSAITAVEAIRKPAELWILERSTLHALSDLKRGVNYRIADGESKLDPDVVFEQVEEILNSAQQDWVRKVRHTGEGERR
jgi:hypothetical protein